jgi:branched-chain amino acid transport system permease protein
MTATTSTAKTTATASVAMSWLRTLWPLLGLMIPITIVVALLSFGDGSVQDAGVGVLVNLLMVVGLYIFIGNSGVQSFGHIAFVAIGAYVSAILTIPKVNKAFALPALPPVLAGLNTSLFVATVIAAVVAGIVALVVAFPLMKLSGIAAGIATFALLIIVQNVASNWTAVTGGLGTLTGIPTDLTLWGALACAFIAMIVAFAYSRSRFGARLRASRDDGVAATAIGVKTSRERLIAFVISAMVMGGAGSLYAHRLGAFGPGSFYIDLTFLTLTMLIVGGMRSLAGAVVGTAVMSVINEALTQWQSGQPVGPITLNLPTGTADLFLALVLVLVLIFRPDGVTRSKELRWPLGSRKAKRRDPAE